MPRRNVGKLAGRSEAGGRRVRLEWNKIVPEYSIPGSRSRRPVPAYTPPPDAGSRCRGARAAGAGSTSCKAATRAEVVSGTSAIAKAIGVPMIDRNRRRSHRNRLHRRQSRKRPSIGRDAVHSTGTEVNAGPGGGAKAGPGGGPHRLQPANAPAVRIGETSRTNATANNPLQQHDKLPHNRNAATRQLLRTPVSLMSEVAPIGLRLTPRAG